ncbi:MAG: hypothetical protein ACLGI5_13240 [Thermoleophilia bacterium]
MIELTVLALMNRLMHWGREPVIATRQIAADAAGLRDLVSDPARQSRLVAAIGTRLRPQPPRPTARLVVVCAQLMGRDALWLTWILTSRRGTTDVDLAAQLDSRGVLARLALLLGGRRSLQRRLERSLDVLAAMAHAAAENVESVDCEGSLDGRRARSHGRARRMRPPSPRTAG